MFDRGDAVSQWPETQKGIIVDYHWNEHIDEPMCRIKWPDGKTTVEYENTLNHYCNPDDDTEDMEEEKDDWENYSKAFNEMYDLIEDGREFPDARQDVSIKYNLSEEVHEQLVIDYDECERVSSLNWRP